MHCLWICGTGKTRTTLEFIKYRENKITKVVWLCPCSVKNNLIEDINKHCDSSVQDIEHYKNEFIIVAGTESIGQSDNIYLKINAIIENNPNIFLIVDESHMIKNHNSKRFKRVENWTDKTRYRIILTGTPVTQNMQDLYTQFKFLSPKILGYNSFNQFAKNHIKYSEKYPGMIIGILNQDYITTKINPYIYQIKKEECLNLIPKKYEEEKFNMSEMQEYNYEIIKDYFLNELEYKEFNSTLIFRLFGYLQRISCGYLKYEHINFIDYSRSKLLKKITDNNCDKKIIVFYKYNSDVKLIKRYIKKCYLINGYVKNNDRQNIINSFKNSNKKVLLLNITSGSYGLNLQFADCLIYYDNTFDFAKRIQSEDRIYRIGQEKQATIIDIVCNNGIDRKIMDNLAGKGDVAEDLKQKIKKAQQSKEEAEKLRKEIKNEW